MHPVKITVIVCLAVFKISNAVLMVDSEGLDGIMDTSTITPESNLPPEHWFTQLLDHFDTTNNIIWKQKYHVLTDHHKTGGPVFLLVAGEWETHAGWMVNANWVNYAKQYNALMFQVEHRYYGKSHPTSDMSVENLRYLTIEQALADLAYFVSDKSREHNLPKDTKWIAFGGSYAGNMAAWLRAAYPELIYATMSASGPITAKADFYEFFNTVGDSLDTAGNQCSHSVQDADKELKALLRTESGRERVNNIFRLCDPIDVKEEKDIQNLLFSLAKVIADIVVCNKNNAIYEPTPRNITIDVACDILTNQSLGDYVDRYAKINSMMLDMKHLTCLDYKYDNWINGMKNITWNDKSKDRLWMYQSCTELGFFWTSNEKDALYHDNFPLNFHLQQCSDVFGDAFTEDVVRDGVNKTNTLHGGKNLKATRIVYVHGSIDPWHSLGILNSTVPQSPVIYINGTTHCTNMYPPRDSDLPDLKAAREEVGRLIGVWLNEK